MEQAVRFIFAEVAGPADAEFAGEAVVEPQAEGVVRRGPPFFAGDDESFTFEEVRCVFAEAAAFAQGFTHEGYVALGEIAYTTVYELGAAAGCAFGEVHAFEQ